MHKRKLHHLLVRLRAIPRFGLLAAAVIFFIIGIFAYRNNNLRMLELREAVFVADEQDGDVEGALKALREHVYAHMNTDLTVGDTAIRPPIQLKYTYQRLIAGQLDAQTDNEGLYTEAQNYCEQQLSGAFLGRDKLGCIFEYLDSHGVKVEEKVSVPSDLYKFDFVSPRWSFDLAGWSFIIAAAFLLMGLLRAFGEWLIRRKLAE